MSSERDGVIRSHVCCRSRYDSTRVIYDSTRVILCRIANKTSDRNNESTAQPSNESAAAGPARAPRSQHAIAATGVCMCTPACAKACCCCQHTQQTRLVPSPPATERTPPESTVWKVSILYLQCCDAIKGVDGKRRSNQEARYRSSRLLA